MKYWDIVKNEADGKTTGEILIYGDIGGFDWDTWETINTAKKFRQDFKALESEHDEIHVHINSHGGIVTEGLAISNIIQNSSSKVHTHIDGAAFSMAALIALSGHQVHMAKNSLLMIHNAWTMSWGNSNDLQNASEELTKYDRSLALMIMDRTGKTEEEVFSEFLDFKDHTFNSDEAFDLGLIDSIGDEVPDPAVAKKVNGAQFNKVAAMAFRMPKQPENYAEWSKAVLGKAKTQTPPTNTEPMNLEILNGLLKEGKFNEVLTEDQITGVQEEISAALKEGDIITASDLDSAKNALQEKITPMEATLASLRTELNLDEEGDVVNAVTTLKGDLAEANAKLEKPAPAASPTPAPDPTITDDDPIAKLPHNQRADKLKKTGSIY